MPYQNGLELSEKLIKVEIFQVHIKGHLTELRSQCVDSVKEFSESNGYKYSMLIEPPIQGLPPYIQSDIIRYDYASANPNALYCDTDLVLYSLPIFASTCPYMGRFKSRRFDSFLFYVNNCCEFFKEVLNDAKTNRPDMRRNWMSYTLNKYTEKVKIIEKIHFKHFNLKGR